jgi:hypothetical protein
MHQEWLDQITALLGASTLDLQDGAWYFPPIQPHWAALVQAAGVQAHGDRFRFLGHDLILFASSPLESRLRDETGSIRFSASPFIGDCMVFTGTADAAFTRFRLGDDLTPVFGDYRFVHPQTRWYNLASLIGARRSFRRNAPQILDFFAGLVMKRLSEGKRCLLIAKKMLVAECARALNERFGRAGVNLEVVVSDFTEESLADPRTVPLINYGTIGTNLFEDFDAAYCLTSYYVNEAAVSHCLQDVVRPDLRLPIRIDTKGAPRRRHAVLANPDDRYYDLAALVQPALEFLEHSTVVQAAGRVRPFTRPREVITFQTAELPGVVYDQEFLTLDQMRQFFGVASGREASQADLKRRIVELRAQGKTQIETANALGVSERTVRNHENRRTGNEP